MSRGFCLVLAVALFGAVLGAPSGDDLDTKVMGGVAASAGEFPYQVSLQLETPAAGTMAKFCGGAIISDTWILTAAHCYIELEKGSQYYIKAGITDSFGTDANTQKVYISKILTHGGYNPKQVDSLNDITLLKLATPLKFNRYVQSIKLPAASYVATGNGLVVGWGAIDPAMKVSSRNLLWAEVVCVTTEECQKYNRNAGPTQVCVNGKKAGVSACAGDSGGPFVQFINGMPTVVGVTSYGKTVCGTAPVVYTSVAHHLKWIQDTMAAN